MGAKPVELFMIVRYNIIIPIREDIAMPERSRFYGIIVKMVFNDNDKHHKPHVHVYMENTRHQSD